MVLVTRNTLAAAGRAVAATTALTGPGARIAVLVVVSDGLPEPAEAGSRFRVLEGRIGALVRMPFVPAFRVAASPLHVDLPRKAARALAEIRALAQEQMPRPALRHQTVRETSRCQRSFSTPWPCTLPRPGTSARSGSGGYLAAGVPDPPAQAPPGLTGPGRDTILGWIKWGTLIGGSVGLSICAVKMMVGHRNRSSLAADGASGIPWVLLGLSLAAVSSGVVGVFL